MTHYHQGRVNNPSPAQKGKEHLEIIDHDFSQKKSSFFGARISDSFGVENPSGNNFFCSGKNWKRIVIGTVDG